MPDNSFNPSVASRQDSALPSPNAPGFKVGDFFVRNGTPNETYQLQKSSGVRTWVLIANGSAAVNTVTISGGGAASVPPQTDIVFLDPAGANLVLTLPLLSLQQSGRSVRIVLVSNGTISVVAGAGDTLWTGAAALSLCCVGDSVLLSPGSEWRLVDLYGALMDFEIYVSSTGNDDAAGTALDPVATITEAITRAGSLGWRRYGLIYVSAGSFAQPPGSAWSIPYGNGADAWPLQIIGTEGDSGLGTLTVGAFVPGPANEAAGPSITGLALGAGDYRGYRVRMTGGTSVPAINRQSFMVGNNDAASVALSAASGYFTLNAGDQFVLEQPTTIVSWSDLPGGRFSTITGAPLVLRSIRFDLPTFLYVQETLLLLQHFWLIGTGSPGSRNLYLWGGAELYSGWSAIGRFGLKVSPTFNPSELDRCGVFARMNSGGVSAQPEGIISQNNSVSFLYDGTFVDSTLVGSGQCSVGFFSSFMHGNGRVSADGGGACYAYGSTWLNVTPRAATYPAPRTMGAFTAESATMDCASCRFELTNGISILVRGCSGFTYLNNFVSTLGNDIEILKAASMRLFNNTASPGPGIVQVGAAAPVSLAVAAAGTNDLTAGPLSQLCYAGG